MAAWCAWRRSSFQAGLPLHRWTWRFGAVAAATAALFASQLPWSAGCHAHHVIAPLLSAISLVFLGALKVIQQILVAHKLEELRCGRLARTVRALSVAALLSLVACPATRVLQWHAAITEAFGDAMGLCYALACISGLWGLLGTAGRAALSSRGAKRRGACFILLSAATLAFSFACTICMLLNVDIRTSYNVSRQVVFYDHWFWVADAMIDCISVALCSGLAGPTSLQVLARDAFAAINSYDHDQLQGFYEKYLEYLDRAQVKWVRCGYLRRLVAAGHIMPRCQEVPRDQAVLGSNGFPLVRDGPKARFVLSHPWLSKEHPDPTGAKLRMLVRQLDMLLAGDDDAIFIDYLSLPQNDKQNPELRRLELEQRTSEPGKHPAVRTEAEEAQFKVALSAMEQIYSIGKTRVIVLPMGSAVERGREYISRGWCFLEFCLAMSFGNIANAEIHEPVRRLVEDVQAKDGDTIDGFARRSRAHTSPTRATLTSSLDFSRIC
ncbi:unnamed protein product [Prorocentrum cordatum]|nr:unnamed protein product [Polarella glacialis]